MYLIGVLVSIVFNTGLFEALHEECKPFGIDVIIIEPGFFRTDLQATNAKGLDPSTDIPDSQEVNKRDTFLSREQPGDPKKCVRAVVDVITQTGPAKGRGIPERLALGSDAFQAISQKLEKVKKGMEDWKTSRFPLISRKDSEPQFFFHA